jgi:hypothetical protein
MSVINVNVTSAGSANVSVSNGSTVNATVGNGGTVNVALGTISPGNATVVSGTLTINSTTTLAAGQQAYVKNDAGTAYAAKLDIGIPAGPATLVTIGNTTTLSPSSNATVTGTTSGSNLTLAFGIPRGATPAFAIGSVVTGAAGSSASVTATTTNSGANVTLDLTIPRGDPGSNGSNGTNGTVVTLSDGTPANLGTAAPGTSNLAARADHLHQMPQYSSLLNIPANFPTNTTLVSGLSAGYSGINHAHNYVTSFNNLTGGITLAAGSNVTLTANGSTLTLASSGGIGANDAIDGGDYVGEIVYSGTITISQQPQNQTAANAAATFNVAANISPVGNLAYQWQRSDDNGSTWLTLTGATASNVTLSNLTFSSDNGDKYRVVVSSSGASSVTSSTATLTVRDNWSGTGIASSKWTTTTNFLTASFTATRSGLLYIDFDYTVNVNNGYLTGFGVLKNGIRISGQGSAVSFAGSWDSTGTSFSAGDTITVRRETAVNGAVALDTAGDRTINSMSLWIA